MIEALRRRFVLISSVSVAAVFGLVFTVLFFVGTAQRDSTMDTLVDTVAAYGVDPSVGAQATVPLLPDINLDQSARPTSVTEQLDGRFFSVWVGTSGNALGLNVGDNSPVSTERAWHLAQSALLNGPERGWADGYRYLIQHAPDGVLVIFVNGEATMESTNQLLLVAAVVFLLSWALITALVTALSKRAIEPAIESFEKQRQFVTDANHELKTPLTLMLSNLDIIEAESGPSEWVDDTREEGRRMARLVSQLVALSRMDENGANLRNDPVELDAVVRDAVGEFAPLAEERGKRLTAQVDDGRGLLRRRRTAAQACGHPARQRGEVLRRGGRDRRCAWSRCAATPSSRWRTPTPRWTRWSSSGSLTASTAATRPAPRATALGWGSRSRSPSPASTTATSRPTRPARGALGSR